MFKKYFLISFFCIACSFSTYSIESDKNFDFSNTNQTSNNNSSLTDSNNDILQVRRGNTFTFYAQGNGKSIFVRVRNGNLVALDYNGRHVDYTMISFNDRARIVDYAYDCEYTYRNNERERRRLRLLALAIVYNYYH